MSFWGIVSLWSSFARVAHNGTSCSKERDLEGEGKIFSNVFNWNSIMKKKKLGTDGLENLLRFVR